MTLLPRPADERADSDRGQRRARRRDVSPGAQHPM